MKNDIVKDFLSAIVLDEDRQQYFTMTKRQQWLIRMAIQYGKVCRKE